MKFDYSELPGVKNRSVLAPVVPVTFTYGSQEFATFALVDSGAIGAVMSTVITDELKINWSKIPASIGFTMSGEFRYHKVENIRAEIADATFILMWLKAFLLIYLDNSGLHLNSSVYTHLIRFSLLCSFKPE